MKANIDVLQDALDDAWKWDANHDDVFNDELGVIQNRVDEMKVKLQTI